MTLIRIKQRHHLTEADVTDEKLFNERRNFMKTGVSAASIAALASYFPHLARASINDFSDRIAAAETTRTIDDEELNSFDEITQYNNFYELGTGKSDPYRNADLLQTDPWSIEISGECNKPGTLSVDDLLAPHDFEERIYRLRCVEAWSMVIPWTGFSLSKLLERFEPNSNAKYVAFETLYDRANPLPGQRTRVLRWPYREGLRIDEAMHPLTMLVTGLYGKPLPAQNGAPIRLAVPWKYGFKSIKSIVKIRFSETEPETSWNLSQPREYGFYSNVNPRVNHPRWSQASERRIGEFFRRDTLMFNGYEDEVASLYAGMDLAKYY